MGAESSENQPAVGTVVGGGYGTVQQDENVIIVNGIAVQQESVSIVRDADEPHFWPSFVLTSIFGIFGMVGTMICCPTKHGFLGTATGCAVWNTARAILLVVALIIATYKSCDDSLFPNQISEYDCQKNGGNFTNGACLGYCPDGYDMMFTDNGSWSQWCYDPTPCFGVSRTVIVVHLWVAITFAFLSYLGIRHYTRKIQTTPPNYVTV